MQDKQSGPFLEGREDRIGQKLFEKKASTTGVCIWVRKEVQRAISVLALAKGMLDVPAAAVREWMFVLGAGSRIPQSDEACSQ